MKLLSKSMCMQIYTLICPYNNSFVTDFITKQEYVLWNAVFVPLLQFARYCCRGHVTLAMQTFRKLFSEVTSRLSLEHACQI